MVILRPKDMTASSVVSFKVFKIDTLQPGFIIHPSTSQIAEQLTIDPQALNGENYSGIYDEAGDYIPQYCDNPDKIPQGGLAANLDKSPATTPPAESPGVTPPGVGVDDIPPAE